MHTVVQAGASEVSIENGDGSLSEAGVAASGGLQQVVNDDTLAHFILHREDHCLTIAQLLKQRETDTRIALHSLKISMSRLTNSLYRRGI